MMFSEFDFYDRINEVKKCGINTVEFWKWTNKDVDKVRQRGLEPTLVSHSNFPCNGSKSLENTTVFPA